MPSREPNINSNLFTYLVSLKKLADGEVDLAEPLPKTTLQLSDKTITIQETEDSFYQRHKKR